MILPAFAKLESAVGWCPAHGEQDAAHGTVAGLADQVGHNFWDDPCVAGLKLGLLFEPDDGDLVGVPIDAEAALLMRNGRVEAKLVESLDVAIDLFDSTRWLGEIGTKIEDTFAIGFAHAIMVSSTD